MGDKMKMASIRLHYIVVNKKPPPPQKIDVIHCDPWRSWS